MIDQKWSVWRGIKHRTRKALRSVLVLGGGAWCQHYDWTWLTAQKQSLGRINSRWSLQPPDSCSQLHEQSLSSTVMVWVFSMFCFSVSAWPKHLRQFSIKSTSLSIKSSNLWWPETRKSKSWLQDKMSHQVVSRSRPLFKISPQIQTIKCVSLWQSTSNQQHRIQQTKATNKSPTKEGQWHPPSATQVVVLVQTVSQGTAPHF